MSSSSSTCFHRVAVKKLSTATSLSTHTVKITKLRGGVTKLRGQCINTVSYGGITGGAASTRRQLCNSNLGLQKFYQTSCSIIPSPAKSRTFSFLCGHRHKGSPSSLINSQRGIKSITLLNSSQLSPASNVSLATTRVPHLSIRGVDALVISRREFSSVELSSTFDDVTRREDTGELVQPLTTLQLWRYSVQCSIPMMGFGFMDNMIMILIGDLIDSHFSAMFSTLTAAAFGQCCSDVAGTTFSGVVDAFCAKMGLPDAKVSPAQSDFFAARVVRTTSMGLGVMIGCVMGMLPLLFIDTKRNERLQKQKELKSLFTSVAEEGQKSLNVERCSLYIDEDGEATHLWALAKNWVPSKEQIADAKQQAMHPNGMLSVELLQNSFKRLGFSVSTLPTEQQFITDEELPKLLKKMLSNNNKLRKKRIKRGGTKYMVLQMDQPKILNIRDVYQDERFGKSRKYNIKERSSSEDVWRAHSVLVGPVMRGGKIIGVIEMINKKSGDDLEGKVIPFSRTDERLMRLLCNHCSIFLDQLGEDEDLGDILNLDGENQEVLPASRSNYARREADLGNQIREF